MSGWGDVSLHVSRHSCVYVWMHMWARICPYVNSTLGWPGECWNSVPAVYLVHPPIPDHSEYKMLAIRTCSKDPPHPGLWDIGSFIWILKVWFDWRLMCGWIDFSCKSGCFCSKCVKNKFQIAALLHLPWDSHYHPLGFRSNTDTYSAYPGFPPSLIFPLNIFLLFFSVFHGVKFPANRGLVRSYFSYCQHNNSLIDLCSSPKNVWENRGILWVLCI